MSRHNLLFLIGSAALASMMPSTASADDRACRSIKAKILEVFKTQTQIKAVTENRQNGKLFLTSTQYIQERGNFMVEVPQQKQWSRQYDGGFYNSTDGKNWKLLGKKDPDWSEKWADHNKRIISDASEFKCGLTKVIGGKEYPGLSYRFKVEKPHKQDYTSMEYYDPETFVLKQSIINQQNFELTTTYEKDTTIALSPPE